MAEKRKRACSHPGCGEISDQPYCPTHRKEREKRKGSAASRGYGYDWQKAREAFLRENPLCVRCEAEGRIEPATVVDHIIPHKGDMASFWRRSNWQALCKTCHDVKTAKEDGGFGRAVVIKRIEEDD